MAVLTVFTNTVLQHLAWTSAQAALLVGLLWLLCRLLPRLPAAIRCALWWLVAAQLLLGLVWQTPVHLPLLQPVPVAAVAERSPALQSPANTPIVQAAVGSADLVTATTHASGKPVVAAPLPWRQILIALWLAGLAVQLVIAARQWQRTRHLRGTSRPLRDPQLQALCRRQAQQLRLRACPELRICDAIEAPQVTGLRHPVVLVPARHTLAPDECAMALAHELAHLRRGDLWLVWPPVIARWLFFFHPLVHLAVREYGLNREAACDGQALRLQRVLPDTYGRLLLRLGVESPMSAGLAGVASPSFRYLKRRLVMLEQAANVPRAWDWLLVAVMAVAFVVPYRAVAASQATATTIERPTTGKNAVVSRHSVAHLSVTQENGYGSLRWHDGRDTLVLGSNGATGVRVLSVQPKQLFGLRESDVIVGVNGQPVSQVGTLLERLRSSKPKAVKLQLHRNGSSLAVALTASEYERILPPPPPPPPAPPPAPPPPQPPPPPPPPTSG